MTRKVHTPEDLARLRARGNDGTFLDALEKAVQEANVSEILRMPTARKASTQKCQPAQRSQKKTDSSEDSSSSQVIVTLPPTTEWQYRGRSGPENNASQPIPAPSGLGSQKDEGFQRFYKAVVSPTHVRVTAGGRIVPNNRGPPSPNKKDLPQDHPADGRTGGPASQPSASTTPQAQPPIGFPAAYPGIPAGMMAPQVPFAPYPWGCNIAPGFAYPPGIPYGFGRAAPTPSGDMFASRDGSGHPQGLDGAGGVRISPPKQFDPVRPYFVNGQWVLPLGGQPPMPYGAPQMMPHPGFYGTQYPGPAAPQGQGQAQAPPPQAAAHANASGSGQNSTAPQNQNAQPPTSTPANAPANPPISSIRPSQITKSHIESLRQNLKRVEDQLQYNVHQIDVKHMDSLAQEIRDSIKALEQALPRQLEFEELHYPKAEKQEPKPNGELFNLSIPHHTPQHNGLPASRKRSSNRGGVNLAKPTKGIFSLESGFPRSVSSDSDASRNFSGLPMTAAAAPPFQPSTQQASSSDDAGKDKADGERIDILSPGSKNCQSVGTRRMGDKLAGSPSGQSRQLVNGRLGINGVPPISIAMAHSAPYLVGYLPPGVDGKEAVERGFVYPRELTAEEIRARHLYWGQAPLSAMKDLPKFDGKDFYPPSPTKARDASRPSKLGAVFDTSRNNTTEPFSSGESRNAEAHTRATSYSVPDEVIGGRKPEGVRIQAPNTANTLSMANTKEVSDTTNTVRLRRAEDGSSTSGRKTNELWQMLKKGSASSNALPGEVTSMTAQGYLPQYTTGHAAASLTPAMAMANANANAEANEASLPRSGGKASETGDRVGSGSPLAAKWGENRPPVSELVVESVRNLRF